MFFAKSDIPFPEEVRDLLRGVLHAFVYNRKIVIKEEVEANCWILSYTVTLPINPETIVTRQVMVTIEGRLNPNGCVVEFAPEIMVRKEAEVCVLPRDRRADLLTGVFVGLPIVDISAAKAKVELDYKLHLSCARAWALWAGEATQPFW